MAGMNSKNISSPLNGLFEGAERFLSGAAGGTELSAAIQDALKKIESLLGGTASPGQGQLVLTERILREIQALDQGIGEPPPRNSMTEALAKLRQMDGELVKLLKSPGVEGKMEGKGFNSPAYRKIEDAASSYALGMTEGDGLLQAVETARADIRELAGRMAQDGPGQNDRRDGDLSEGLGKWLSALDYIGESCRSGDREAVSYGISLAFEADKALAAAARPGDDDPGTA